MGNEKNGCYEEKKEGIHMAVLAKPVDKVPLIKKEESRNFIREFNDNKVSNDFLESCKKAGRLFGKRR